MIRSVIYKDDSFLVEFELKNELSEAIKNGHCITNVDETLFEVLRSGYCIGATSASPAWWDINPGQKYVFTQWLRRKSTTPTGYYRFKQPLFKYKLESDADTNPYRAVYGEPPEVIFVDVPLVFYLDLDETRPYNADFAKNIKRVFRIVDKPENVDVIRTSKYEYIYRITNSGVAYDVYYAIMLGANVIQGQYLYKEEQANSDVFAEVIHFGFNIPNQILIAKAGETLRYYDLSKINDGEGDSNIIPIVKSGNKAFALFHSHSICYLNGIILAENSWFTRDEVYNLIANIFGILYSSELKLPYYDLSVSSTEPQQTFELPNILAVSVIYNDDLRNSIQSDGSLRFTKQVISQRFMLYNVSNQAKIIDSIKVLVDGVTIHSESVGTPIGILGKSTVILNNCDLSQVGSTVVSGEAVGTGDGTTKEFYLANKPVKEGSEKIYVNGVKQTRDQDYTVDYETGKITFATAPVDGAQITADYIYYKRFRISFLDPDGNELAFIDRWATFEF